MDQPDFSDSVWHRSSLCDDGSSCVEVARVEGWIGVRDSKETSGPILAFTTDDWQTFVNGVYDGDFGSDVGGTASM
jgi:hypothetical protein